MRCSIIRSICCNVYAILKSKDDHEILLKNMLSGYGVLIFSNS